MNTNFKRKLLAGLLAPVLGLAVGTALAQSSGTTGSQGGTSATQGSGSTSSGGATGSGSTSTGTGAAGTAGTTGTGSSMSGGASGTGSMWNAQHFDRLDKNRDGRISREEAQGDNALRDAWSKLDATNSGSVSRADFDKYSRTLNPNSANPMSNPAPGQGTPK